MSSLRGGDADSRVQGHETRLFTGSNGFEFCLKSEVCRRMYEVQVETSTLGLLDRQPLTLTAEVL